jgi:hypothetical protein
MSLLVYVCVYEMPYMYIVMCVCSYVRMKVLGVCMRVSLCIHVSEHVVLLYCLLVIGMYVQSFLKLYMYVCILCEVA